MRGTVLRYTEHYDKKKIGALPRERERDSNQGERDTMAMMVETENMSELSKSHVK